MPTSRSHLEEQESPGDYVSAEPSLHPARYLRYYSLKRNSLRGDRDYEAR